MATANPVAIAFEHILVPTDFSEVSERALDYAKSLAKQGNSELLLIHVDPPVSLIMPPEGAWVDGTKIEAQHAEQLAQSGAALVSEGYRARTISVTGTLYDELLSAIKRYDVDLIVLGTHGRKGLERLMLGSDAEAMLRHAHCPVLSVGPKVPDLQEKKWNIREVICATTFDPQSAEVAAYAHRVAAQEGAELIFFHMKNKAAHEIDWPSFEAAFHQHADKGIDTHSWLRSRIARVAPGSSIADLAKKRRSDLIVMGARPASSVATHLPPGAAARVLMEAPCPVLTLLQSCS